MPVKTEAVGKEYPATTYEVGLEKIREYANAVGQTEPVHHDREAARRPPASATSSRRRCSPSSTARPPMGPAILDPEVGINFAAMVHGGQEFVWGEPVCAGDEITTRATVSEIYEKDGKGFYVFESVSTNQDGDEVVRATWTNIVRGV